MAYPKLIQLWYCSKLQTCVRSGRMGSPSCRPRWLSWMRRPTGDQEVTGSTPTEPASVAQLDAPSDWRPSDWRPGGRGFNPNRADLGGSVGCAVRLETRRSRVQPPPSRPRWLSWMRRPTGDQEVAGSTPAEVGNIFSWIDHDIFSAVILSLPLIQEGKLSVSGERMCTILVNRLED